MQNSIEGNSECFFNENCNNNDFKMNNLSSTSLKDDSIKIYENNNFYFPRNSEKENLFQNSIVSMMNIPSLNQNNKVFLISKSKKRKGSSYENKSQTDEGSELEGDIEINESNPDNRVSANSKVNFSKLTDIEKDDRLKNLAKLVKRLRRKTRNLEQRFKKNANKILTRYMSNSLGIKKYKQNTIPFNFTIDTLCKSLKILRNYENFEYDDQKHVIENFINMIAEEKISLDSINFRKVCTQIRLFLSKEESNYISKKGQKITFSFPEKDINISTKEYELYSKYKDKEEIIRTIIGIPEDTTQNIYPERINFEAKKANPNLYNEKENLLNNQNQNLEQNLINNLSNINLQDQIKNITLKKYNINDLVNLGMISNNGNLQNLILNSMYSNLVQNFSNPSNPC